MPPASIYMHALRVCTCRVYILHVRKQGLTLSLRYVRTLSGEGLTETWITQNIKAMFHCMFILPACNVLNYRAKVDIPTTRRVTSSDKNTN